MYNADDDDDDDNNRNHHQKKKNNVLTIFNFERVRYLHNSYKRIIFFA